VGVVENIWYPLRSTHEILVTRQLDDGIRMLQIQAHFQNGVIRLCHTSCVSREELLVRKPSEDRSEDTL
jgi:hypothetical protein